MEPVQQVVQRHASPYKGGGCYRKAGGIRGSIISGTRQPGIGHRPGTGTDRTGFGIAQNHGGYQDIERTARVPEEPKLPGACVAGGETGGSMLDVSGLQRFYYVRNFHDMRCKYDRVLSIIREQFLREPRKDEVFIIMSKDRRKVRLFNYDKRSAALFEKRFSANYRFMKVEKEGDETFYSIEWRDVVMLLENAVINKLIIK